MNKKEMESFFVNCTNNSLESDKELLSINMKKNIIKIFNDEKNIKNVLFLPATNNCIDIKKTIEVLINNKINCYSLNINSLNDKFTNKLELSDLQNISLHKNMIFYNKKEKNIYENIDFDLIIFPCLSFTTEFEFNDFRLNFNKDLLSHFISKTNSKILIYAYNFQRIINIEDQNDILIADYVCTDSYLIKK